MIHTFKIQILVDNQDSETKKNQYQQLRDYAYLCQQASNIVMSQAFALACFDKYTYLTEGASNKFADWAKDSEGILTTSYQNTFYRTISTSLKGEMPSSIYGALSALLFKKFKTDKTDILSGKKTLATFKKGMPVPFTNAIKNLRFSVNEEFPNSFNFDLFGINFHTRLGRDKSNNKAVLENIIAQKWKLCDSAYKFQKKEGSTEKLFLLLCVDVPKSDICLDTTRVAVAHLDIENVVTVTFDNKTYEHIGKAESFLYKRLQIQKSLQRAQVLARENKGGKGRKNKIKNTDNYELKELNFVKTELHTYSHRLIKFCLDNNCGTLQLVADKEEVKKTKKTKEILSEVELEDKKFVIRNWGYNGFVEMINYKAKRNNIEVILQ